MATHDSQSKNAQLRRAETDLQTVKVQFDNPAKASTSRLVRAVEVLALNGKIDLALTIMHNRIQSGGGQYRVPRAGSKATVGNTSEKTLKLFQQLVVVPVSYSTLWKFQSMQVNDELLEFYKMQMRSGDRFQVATSLLATRILERETGEALDGHFTSIDQAFDSKSDRDFVADVLVALELLVESPDIGQVKEKWELLDNLPRSGNLTVTWLRQRDMDNTPLDLRLYLLARLPSSEVSAEVVNKALNDATMFTPVNLDTASLRIRFALQVANRHKHSSLEPETLNTLAQLQDILVQTGSRLKNLVNQLPESAKTVASVILTNRYYVEAIDVRDFARIVPYISAPVEALSRAEGEIMAALRSAAHNKNQPQRTRLFSDLESLLGDDFKQFASDVATDKGESTLLRSWMSAAAQKTQMSNQVDSHAVNIPLPGMGGRATSRTRDPGGPKDPRRRGRRR